EAAQDDWRGDHADQQTDLFTSRRLAHALVDVRPPCAVLCCGNIGLDTVVRPVDQFAWGTTTWVDSISQHLGGNGSNTAYTLGMLGVPARLLGMVGNDAFGERILSILQSASVDLAFVGRSKAPTTTTIALVNRD